MFKTISICVALTVIGAGSVNARQREAVLQNFELPGAGVDIVWAMPKSPGATINLAMSPDALVIYLIGGKLALPFNSEKEMLTAFESLKRPACDFQLESKGRTSDQPVSVYVVPNYKVPPAIRAASLAVQQPTPIVRKIEVPGSDFDIVFAMTQTPVVVDPNDRPYSLAVHSISKDVGLPQQPICAFEVENIGSKIPQAASVYIVPKN